jgi:hypothetical protein
MDSAAGWLQNQRGREVMNGKKYHHAAKWNRSQDSMPVAVFCPGPTGSRRLALHAKDTGFAPARVKPRVFDLKRTEGD